MVRARRRIRAAGSYSSSFSSGGAGGSSMPRIRPRLLPAAATSSSGTDGGGVARWRRWSSGGGGGGHRGAQSALALLFSAGAAAAAASLLLPLLLARPAAASAGVAALGALGIGGGGPGKGGVTSACGLGCTEGACVRAVDPAPYYGGYYGAGTPDTVFPKGYRLGAACLSCRDGCYFLATRPNSWITYCGCKRGCGIVPGGLVTRCAVTGKKKRRRQLLGGGGGGSSGHKGSVATSPVLSGQCGLGAQLDCRPCPVDWYQPLDGAEFAECRPCQPGSSTLGFTGQAQCTNIQLLTNVKK